VQKISLACKKSAAAPELSLVAIRALLRVEVVRRNAKHIIALDAHAMKQRLCGMAGLAIRGIHVFGRHRMRWSGAL
jgi:hypothetical protein